MWIEEPGDLSVVRESYDRVADKYVEMELGDLAKYPWLRVAVDGFVEGVRGLGPVLDVGCGPGAVTAYLAERGVDAAGVDLSPRMVEHARRDHPGLRFEVGSATEVELGESSLGGILGWWSLFNLPREIVAAVLRNFGQALVPGGQLIIGIHQGDGEIVRTTAYGGVPVSWTTYLWQPEQLWVLLKAAGLDPVAELRVSESVAGVPSLVLVAQRPVRAGGPGEL